MAAVCCSSWTSQLLCAAVELLCCNSTTIPLNSEWNGNCNWDNWKSWLQGGTGHMTQITWDVTLCNWTGGSLVAKDCSAFILTLLDEGAVIHWNTRSYSYSDAASQPTRLGSWAVWDCGIVICHYHQYVTGIYSKAYFLIEPIDVKLYWMMIISYTVSVTMYWMMIISYTVSITMYWMMIISYRVSVTIYCVLWYGCFVTLHFSVLYRVLDV